MTDVDGRFAPVATGLEEASHIDVAAGPAADCPQAVRRGHGEVRSSTLTPVHHQRDACASVNPCMNLFRSYRLFLPLLSRTTTEPYTGLAASWRTDNESGFTLRRLLTCMNALSP